MSDDKKTVLSGPVYRIREDKPTERVGTLTLELPKTETIYEAPDANSSSVGYSAAYSAAFDRVFKKPRPEELN